MKIGFISMMFPEDPRKTVAGVYRRMGMFIQAMKEMGELDMLFYVRSELASDAEYISEMKNQLARHWNVNLRLDLCPLTPVKPAKGRWEEYILPALSIQNHPPYLKTAQREQIAAVHRMLDRKPDILFVHRLECMIPVLLSKRPHPDIYFDMDDIEHVAYLRSIKQPPWWPGKRLYYLRLPMLKLWERRAIHKSKETYVCSEHDGKYLSRIYGCNNVTVIPNAVDIPIYQELPHEPIILFLGNMNYLPNAVAADYLIRTIWPEILQAMPNAKLIIAGENPDRIPSYSDHPAGVQFPGFVEDLEKMYKGINVVCCPILAGGGTRIKILEAAAFGKPVVSTTLGAEGIELVNGEEILLRDDPKSIAQACLRLLKDRNSAQNMGKAARSAVTQQYEWSNVVHRIRRNMTEPGDRCA